MGGYSLIKTLHPQGKEGTDIRLDKYMTVKDSIMSFLRNEDMSRAELTKSVAEEVRESLTGSIERFVEAVELDLEARKIIERVANDQSLRYRLKRPSVSESSFKPKRP